VDDGLATGATMQAAVEALRQRQPARIVVAVPTASPEICEELRRKADEVICAVTPQPFHAVGFWYEDFSQTTDEEVRDLLARTQQPDEKQTVPDSGDTALVETVRATAHRLTIGVIYRPETERMSHHFRARLPDQFEAVLHFEETRAVEPLERSAGWEAGEVPETFPFEV
jgi:hypothetical protein